MFEKYNEKARRTIFFARYEASQLGNQFVEPEHLLLALIREDQGLAKKFFHSRGSVEGIRARIEKHLPFKEKVSTSVDLPLSEAGKRILALAAEESEGLGHQHIGTEHLLLGILREEKTLAATILLERGLRLPAWREELSRQPAEKPSSRTEPLLPEFTRDLTQLAAENKLDPLIGRESEFDRLIHILCRRTKNNPILIGETGVGKTAMVRGLACHIAQGKAPEPLAGKRILALDLPPLLGGRRASRRAEENIGNLYQALAEATDAIFFIDDLNALIVGESNEGSPEAANVLLSAVLRAEIQCIASATEREFQKAIERDPRIERGFLALHVPPPSEADAVKILFGIRERYEKFHSVTYTEEALRQAVHYSARFLPDRFLPDKAIDLVDEAAVQVKLRQKPMPEEIIDAQKRLTFNTHRFESAIANHEFEKGRIYSEEERKERANLERLREKYKIDETAPCRVTVEDIEEVLARRIGVPADTIRQSRGSADSPSSPSQG